MVRLTAKYHGFFYDETFGLFGYVSSLGIVHIDPETGLQSPVTDQSILDKYGVIYNGSEPRPNLENMPKGCQIIS